MEQEQNNNDALINEYINTLAKKYNDVALEVVTLQARNNLLSKEKEKLLKSLEAKDADIEGLKAEVIREREKPPVIETKEVIKEVEVFGKPDDALVKENEILKKELFNLERKIKNLKHRQGENIDGSGTETEKVGNR